MCYERFANSLNFRGEPFIDKEKYVLLYIKTAIKF